MTPTPENDQQNVAAARITKIPNFFPDDPELWFSRIEALFTIHGITTDDTKFNYVLAHASDELIPYVTNVIKEEVPTGKTKYSIFKERVTQSFSISNEAKLRALFKGQSLGDKKPSQVLLILKNSAAGQCQDKVLKSLFLENLPVKVRSILSVCDTEDLNKLALIADKFAENEAPASYVNVVKTSTEDDSSKFSSLEATVNRLTAQLQSLRAEVRRSRSKSRNRGNFYTNNKSNNNNNANFQSKVNNPSDCTNCYFHNKFGDQAFKCKPPCSWKSADKEISKN